MTVLYISYIKMNINVKQELKSQRHLVEQKMFNEALNKIIKFIVKLYINKKKL